MLPAASLSRDQAAASVLVDDNAQPVVNPSVAENGRAASGTKTRPAFTSIGEATPRIDDAEPSSGQGSPKASRGPMLVVTFTTLGALAIYPPGLFLPVLRTLIWGCIAITGVGGLYCWVRLVLQTLEPIADGARLSNRPLITAGLSSVFVAVLCGGLLMLLPAAEKNELAGWFQKRSAGNSRLNERSDVSSQSAAAHAESAMPSNSTAEIDVRKPEYSATKAIPPRRPAREFKASIVGTYESELNADRHMSIAFLFPFYVLNPNKDYIWASGNTGQWELFDDSESLTATDRAAGFYVMALKPPDASGMSIPCNVKFEFDKNGLVSAMTFASLLGIRFPDSKHCILHRLDGNSTTDRPSSGSVTAHSYTAPAPVPQHKISAAELERIKTRSAELGSREPQPLPKGYGEMTNAK
jgi:hypothetical protein